MEAGFSRHPHTEAAELIAGKPVVVRDVFANLLPDIQARVFTISGIESANALQAARDAVASVPLGDQTWDQAKKELIEQLDPYLGDGAKTRAEMVLRVNAFTAFSASVHRVGMEDDDTTHWQYLHGECEVPTPSHLALNGVILPKDDPFWDTHTGPWGHLGCVCYKRPLNEDLVADAKASDGEKNPEDKNVIAPAVIKQLNHGTIVRNGKRYDTTIDGPDNSGFTWNPGNLRIPVKDLAAKYEPATWQDFKDYAQSTKLETGHTLWDWLNGKEISAPAKPEMAGLQLLADKAKAAKLTPVIRQTILDLPPAVAPLVENLKVASSGRKGAHYRRAEKTIFLKRDPEDWSGAPEAAVHEIGHHLHYETGVITENHIDPKFLQASRDDWTLFKDWAEDHIGPNWKSVLCDVPTVQLEAIAKALGYTGDINNLPMADRHRISRFADTIQGLSKGAYGCGHGTTYMLYNGSKEVFTHAWVGLVDSDEEFGKVFSGVTDFVRNTLKL